jgi:hypothetical protein
MQGFIILAQQYRMNAVTSNNSIPGTPENTEMPVSFVVAAARCGMNWDNITILG